MTNTNKLDTRIADLASGRMTRLLEIAGVLTLEAFVKLGSSGIDALRGAGKATVAEYLLLLPDLVEALGADDGAEEVDTVLEEQGRETVAATLAEGHDGWDEIARNFGAAESTGVPAVLHDVYYTAYAKAARARAEEVASQD